MRCLLPLSILSLLTPASLASVLSARDATLPFNFTYLFSAHLVIGKPLSPIAIAGGLLLTEPIANGTVTGPSINATILGGIATPALYSNGSVQAPVIQAWGMTSDGFAFAINELGIGGPKGQVTRIQLNVAGGSQYNLLRNGYILASVTPNQQRNEVSVQGYLVNDIATYV